MNSKDKTSLTTNSYEIIVDGRGHYDTSILYSSEIAKYLSELPDFDAMSDFLKKINGFYNAVVINLNNKEVFIAVDHVRSKPLFYKENGSWGTNALDMVEAGETLSPTSEATFIKTGWTIGSSTLFSSVSQVQAGEHVILKPNGGIEKHDVFTHLHTYDLKDHSDKQLYEMLWDTSHKFTNRLTQIAKEKTIIIPLSGGYDSRYIAAMLKHAKVDNVELVSYGQKDSFEIETARKVAKALGYRWHMIEYNPDFLIKYVSSIEFQRYCKMASGGCSLPHIQEFALLGFLRERQIIPDNSIFMPGFCGDVIGGSYMPNQLKINRKKELLDLGLSNYIFEKLFYLQNDISNDQKSIIIEEIEDSIRDKKPKNVEHFSSEFESWFTKHKLAKFVVNAVRAYDFFDYDWHLPLWDHELTHLWYNVPIEKRMNKKLYDGFLLEEVFKPLDVNFKKEHSWLTSGYTGLIRSTLPDTLRTPLKNAYYNVSKIISGKRAYDQNGFKVIAAYFSAELLKKNNHQIKSSDNVNQAEVVWFLKNINLFRKLT